jgi:hypothetical protein
MPDGKRKRRHSVNQARRQWYAQHRSRRFCRRFGWTNSPGSNSADSGRFASAL